MLFMRACGNSLLLLPFLLLLRKASKREKKFEIEIDLPTNFFIESKNHLSFAIQVLDREGKNKRERDTLRASFSLGFIYFACHLCMCSTHKVNPLSLAQNPSITITWRVQSHDNECARINASSEERGQDQEARQE
jgi:hypothetical protein